MKHSEVAARLAIEGAVAAIAGTVKGTLGITPKRLGTNEKIDLGMADIGDTLFYSVSDTGVFLHTDGAFTTIWYVGADYKEGAPILDRAIKKFYPDAKRVKDEPHSTEANLTLRTYDIKLPNDQLAIVDVIYPSGPVENPKFMIRVTAMARQN